MDGNNQYAPPKSVVSDVGSPDSLDKAGRGARLGAAWLDGIIGSLGWIPGYLQLISAQRGMKAAKVGLADVFAAMGPWLYLGIAWTLVVLAVTLVLMKRNGQTMGKKLVGIKVVRTDGSAVSLPRIFLLRFLVNTLFTWIPVAGRLYSLVDCLLIFGNDRRCVHDHLADTIVINA